MSIWINEAAVAFILPLRGDEDCRMTSDTIQKEDQEWLDLSYYDRKLSRLWIVSNSSIALSNLMEHQRQ